MPDFIPIGQCECGCGQEVPIYKKTDFDRITVAGYPGRFILSHSNNYRIPQPGICQCGCGKETEPEEFFVSDHVPDRKQRKILLKNHVCTNCRQILPNRSFPPDRPGFDFVCKNCQDEYRKQQLVRAIQETTKSIQLCKCGCGWPAPLATFNSTKLGIRKGDPLDFIPSHSRDIEIRGDELDESPPVPVDRGFHTPCLERLPKMRKSGIKIYFKERPEGKRYSRVEVTAWENVHGVLFPGQHIFQKCDNLSCENIDHLEMRDMRPAGLETTKMAVGFGFCQCGCGQRTSLAPKTVKYRNWEKGKPVPFARGHSSRNLDEETIARLQMEGLQESEYTTCRICNKVRRTHSDFRMEDPVGICKLCAAGERRRQLEERGGMVEDVGKPMDGIIDLVKNRDRIVPDFETALERAQWNSVYYNKSDYETDGIAQSRTIEELEYYQDTEVKKRHYQHTYGFQSKYGILSYPLPFGICRCGCGEPTAVATFDDPTRGYIKGMPFPFKKRHRRRILPFIIEHPNKLRTDRTKECTNCMRELWITNFQTIESDECNSCAGVGPVSAGLSVLQEVS